MSRLLEAGDDEFEFVKPLLAQHVLHVLGQPQHLVRRELLSQQRCDPHQLDALIARQSLEELVQVPRIGTSLDLEHDLECLEAASRALEYPRPAFELERCGVYKRRRWPFVWCRSKTWTSTH